MQFGELFFLKKTRKRLEAIGLIKKSSKLKINLVGLFLKPKCKPSFHAGEARYNIIKDVYIEPTIQNTISKCYYENIKYFGFDR